MANSLGSLVVSLGLDASQFTSGLTKSQYQAQRFGQSFEKNIAAGIVKAEIAIRAFGAAARTTAEVFQSLTTGAAQFKDLEETTGAAAESIAGLAVSAAVAGVDINDVAGAVNKLTKNLVGVDDESKAAGAALKSLNLNVADFKKLDPVGQYEAVGKALGGYADGAGKVAVAQALFGKSGAEQLKVFKALEEAGGRQTILTQRQIELSDAYQDQQAKSTATLRLYAQAAASEAIPAIADLTSVAVDLAKEFLGIDKVTGQLAANNGAREFAEAAVDALAFLIDMGDGVVRTFQVIGKTIGGYAAVVAAAAAGDFAAARAAGRAAEEDIERVLNRATFAQRIADQRAQSASFVGNQSGAESARLARQNTPSKQLSFNGANTEAAAVRKKELDNQIRAIRAFADAQRSAFDFANQILRGSYEDGLTDLGGFYASQQQLRDRALAAQLSSIDKEIAALRGAKPKDAAERLDIEGKIAEALSKRGEAALKAGREGVLALLEERRAAMQLMEQYDELRAQVLELGGNTAAAAAIRIDKIVESAERLNKALGTNGSIDIPAYRALLESQEAIRKAQADASFTTRQLQLDEERLAVARETGAASEIETLARVGEARRASVAQMESMVAAQEAIAKASGNRELIQNAEASRVALERLKASADPLAQKFSGIFEGEFSDAFFDFASGAKSAGDAFKSFADGVVKQLLRMATQQAATGLFNGTGSSLSGLFSGGGGYNGNTTGPVDGFGGAFANGGFLGSGKWGIAGENGPEPIIGPARVVSNRELKQTLGGGTQVNVHNYGGAQVETKENGSEIDIIIRAASNRAVSEVTRQIRGGGPVHSAMKSREAGFATFQR